MRRSLLLSLLTVLGCGSSELSSPVPGATEPATPVAAAATAPTAELPPTTALPPATRFTGTLPRAPERDRFSPAATCSGPSTSNFKTSNSLASPQIVLVNWTSAVDPGVARNAPSFYADLVNSTYIDQLSEYGVGRGAFLGTYTISPHNTNTSLLDQNAITNELYQQINDGKLPKPAKNYLYVVHMPQNYTIKDNDGQQCAYHTSFSTSSWGNVAWAVITDHNFGQWCDGYRYTTLGAQNDFFFNAAHEVIEAAVNPYSQGNAEIGDTCQKSECYGSEAWTSFQGATHPWFVQKPWLASKNACGGQTLPTPATGSAIESAGPLVGRTPNNLDFFEARADGSVWTSYWYGGQPVGSWPSFRLPGSAVGVKPGSPVAAVSRFGDHLDVFYIGGSGAIWWQFWSSETGWSNAQKITVDGATVVGGGLAAVARGPNNLDVFFYGANSKGLDTLWWAPGVDTTRPWPTYTIANTPNAVQSGASIAAVARRTDTLDVFWIGTWGFLAVSSWNATDNKFVSNNIGGAVALSLDSGLAATARTWNILDVFYLNPQGLLASANSIDEHLNSWKVSSPLVTEPVASYAGASPGHVAAATRGPDNVDVFWANQSGQISTAAYSTGNGWATWQLCSPSLNVTSTAGAPITAISRSGGLDVVETTAGGGVDWNRWWVGNACGGWDSSQIVPDAFSIALDTASTSLPANDTESLQLTTTIGSCSPVALSVSGAPPGVSASLSQSSMSSSGTSWLYLGVALGTAPESGTITVTGTCGGMTHTATVGITTTACVPQTSCGAGQCGNAPNGCGGTIACGGCPSGESCSNNSCVDPPPKCSNPQQCCIVNGCSWRSGKCICI